MNPKARRILATVGFAFMSLFIISFIAYLIKPSLLGGRIGWTSIGLLMVGLVIFAIIYFTRGFPFQQIRDEELKRQREEYEKKQEEKKHSAENKNADTDAKANSEAAAIIETNQARDTIDAENTESKS